MNKEESIAAMFANRSRTLAANAEAELVAALSAVERVPLTDSRIISIAMDAQIDYCLDKFRTFEVAFARAIEKAHGIGVTK